MALLAAGLGLFGAGCGSPSALRETTDATFARDVLDAPTPALVEFRADGCIPCMRLEPHLERAARRHGDRMTFWKLDAGWNAESRRRYHFRAVPTLIVYREGREVARMEGMPTPRTDEALDAFIAGAVAARP
jgi:thioredoxin 1